MSNAEVIDRIYEAAFNPECWNDVIEHLSRATGSDSGTISTFVGERPAQFRATGKTAQLMTWLQTEGWKDLRRIRHFYSAPLSGFVVASEYFPQEIEQDSGYQHGARLGLDQQAGTIIPMPSGELAVMFFNRLKAAGRYDDDAIAMLNSAYPHLARSAFVASRLGIEQANSTVSVLEALGLPAAVLSSGGRVIASNALLDSYRQAFIASAFNGLALALPSANALFQSAVAQASFAEGTVRSIPIPGIGDEPPCVVHVVPMRRTARDLFSGAHVLVAATTVSASRIVPEPTILMGLFDLTPAEVRIATALTSGKTLQQSADHVGIRVSTARAYLNSIFRKTGTNQQSQLVALLSSTQPL